MSPNRHRLIDPQGLKRINMLGNAIVNLRRNRSSEREKKSNRNECPDRSSERPRYYYKLTRSKRREHSEEERDIRRDNSILDVTY